LECPAVLVQSGPAAERTKRRVEDVWWTLAALRRSINGPHSNNRFPGSLTGRSERLVPNLGRPEPRGVPPAGTGFISGGRKSSPAGSQTRHDQLGENNPGSAIILHNLAALYTKTGRYSEAEKRLKQTLIVLESELGPEDPIVALNLSNLGVLYSELNRCEEAEPLLRRALAIMEKTYGTENASVAVGLTNLATVYTQSGEYRQAESMFRRALSILETSESPNLYLATVDQNLGALYLRQGNYLQAETYCRRALEDMEKAHRQDHPQVAGALRVYAEVPRKEKPRPKPRSWKNAPRSLSSDIRAKT
jgi:tetratricopeptide (TPR) repeat protein